MRYLLIDRIHRLECNNLILAIKNVALSEDIYTEHFVGFPVMPGALLIECLAQAGTALLEVSAELKKKALLAIVDKAKFRLQVRPGDQLTISARVISMDQISAQVEGTVNVGDRLAVSAKLTFVLENSEKYYPPKVRHLVEAMYQVWLKDAELIGVSIQSSVLDG